MAQAKVLAIVTTDYGSSRCSTTTTRWAYTDGGMFYSLQVLHHKLVFIETTDVIETTMVTLPLPLPLPLTLTLTLALTLTTDPKPKPKPKPNPDQALENFKRACDCGRGAIFLSVARGKVAGGVDQPQPQPQPQPQSRPLPSPEP